MGMKSLCFTHPLHVFISLIALIGLNATLARAATDNDTIHTIDYIEKISITEPHRALRLIDETEAIGRMPRFSLDQLRSIVYQNGLSMDRTALTYALKAYQNDSIRHYPDEMLLTLRMLTYQYNSTGNYTESIRYAIEGIELAGQRDNKEFEAIFRLYIAINKREMGLKKEAEPYLAEAVSLMEQVAEGSQVSRRVNSLIYIYGMTVTFAYEDGEYQKAIDLLPRYLRLMEQFKGCTDLFDGLYDMRLASVYIMYASVFAADGQMQKAEEYYRKFDALEYAHTGDGNQMRFEYLITTRRYREALRFIRDDKENYRAQGDTVNYFYVDRTLRFEAESHMGLGDYKAAAHTYQQMYALADSLRLREKKNGVLEFATIYKTREKEAQIAEQAVRLRESRMIILFAGCLAVLLGALLWRTVRHVRIIRQKNIALVRTIREQLAYKDELFLREEEVRTLREELRRKRECMNRMEEALPEKGGSMPEVREPRIKPEGKNRPDITLSPMPEEVRTGTPQEDSPETSSGAWAEIHAAGRAPEEEYTEATMQRMFAKANYEIISRKLYLKPDFSREELMEMINIPHNKFAGLFKMCAGMSFSKYINKLRLEHAARLLEEHPEYSLEAIASDSGISSSTTFYRLFSERFGMTPKDFRAGINQTEE